METAPLFWNPCLNANVNDYVVIWFDPSGFLEVAKEATNIIRYNNTGTVKTNIGWYHGGAVLICTGSRPYGFHVKLTSFSQSTTLLLYSFSDCEVCGCVVIPCLKNSISLAGIAFRSFTFNSEWWFFCFETQMRTEEFWLPGILLT